MSKSRIDQEIKALLEGAQIKGIRPVDAAIRTLLQAAREESVSPVEIGFLGLNGLSPDERILLAVVSLYVNLGSLATVSHDIHAGRSSETNDLPVEITDSKSKSDLEPTEAKKPSIDGADNSINERQIQAKTLTRAPNESCKGNSPKSAEEKFVKVDLARVIKEKQVKALPGILDSQISIDKNHGNYSARLKSLPDGAAKEKSPLENITGGISAKEFSPSEAPLGSENSEKHAGRANNLEGTITRHIHLKNAKVNEPYSEKIDIPEFTEFWLSDDGGVGLSLNGELGTITGQPGISGDFVLRIKGLLAGRHCEVSASLAVIPDPRSLWISKPHDPTAPFAKDDEDSAIRQGDLLCVAASKRGRSHAREGLFRDDDFALWTGGAGGWNIAVVADGAGSAKYSRRGSQIAVRTIVRDLPQLLDEHLTGQIDDLATEYIDGVEGAAGRIRTQLYFALARAAFNSAMAISLEAEEVEDRASAFSTTLVLSVARRVSKGWFIAGFSIGDGGAAVFDLPSRTVIPLTLADSGEFAGQTRFLQRSEFNNGDEVAKRLFFDVRDSFTAVIAMTDGVTDPKFPTDSAFSSSEVWCSFWETDLSQSVLLNRGNPSLERELLGWLDFWSPGNHDDRTIAIMLL